MERPRSAGSTSFATGSARHATERLLKEYSANLYNPSMTNIAWGTAREFEDIRYEKAEGIAKIPINRPEVRNAFRPLTVTEMGRAFTDARDDADTGVVILTG